MKVCKDYLVVPPVGEKFDDPALHSAVLSALNEQFPEYSWEIYTGNAARKNIFLLLPARVALPPVGETIAIDMKALGRIGEFLYFEFIESL